MDMLDDEEPVNNVVNQNQNDDIDEGEKEFIKQDEEDYNDDTLDDDNYGFIYS